MTGVVVEVLETWSMQELAYADGTREEGKVEGYRLPPLAPGPAPP